jgi:hypothetical protein
MKVDYSKRGLVRLGKRSLDKLDKLKLRLKYLEADCIMLAASVAYLGPIPVEQRIKIRKELSELLLLQSNLEASNCWSNTENEQVNCKYFLKVLKNDYGLQ